jgi:cell shape-determining protein MreD
LRKHVAWWGILATGLLIQSTLLPSILPPPWVPDVTRALVLWLALTGSPRGGVGLAFVAGHALGAVSGAPLGFCAALRLTLYGLARPLRGVFFDDHPPLLLPFAALGAWVDAVVAGLLGQLVFSSPLPASVLASTAWRQALVDALWVPLVFVCLEVLSGRHAPREVIA